MLVVSTRKRYSSFLKKVFAFQKICSKVKALKTSNISIDCHIKTKSLVPFFRRIYSLSVGFDMKPLRKTYSCVWLWDCVSRRVQEILVYLWKYHEEITCCYIVFFNKPPSIFRLCYRCRYFHYTFSTLSLMVGTISAFDLTNECTISSFRYLHTLSPLILRADYMENFNPGWNLCRLCEMFNPRWDLNIYFQPGLKILAQNNEILI